MTAGTPFLAVRLGSRRALSDVVLDREVAAELPTGRGGVRPGVPVLRGGRGRCRARPHVRAGRRDRRGSGDGVGRGRAWPGSWPTGSPTGPTAGSVHQGDDMGRPSRMALEVDVSDGVPTAARVGGTAVVVTRGTLDLGAELGGSSTGSYAS